MKLNPKMYEGFTDPEGGHWFLMKSGIYKDVCWRPENIDLPEGSDQMSFSVEFFEGPGFVVPKTTDSHFEKVCGQILVDVLTEMVAKEAAIAENDKPKIIVP